MDKKEKKPLARRLKQAVKGIGRPERPLESGARFGRLYEKTHVLVFRHIYGLCGGPTPLAEDLTAETYLRAWKARATFSGDDRAAAGWLLRIGRNIVIDYHRSGIEQRTAELSDESAYASPNALPEEALIFAEREMILLALLQELPIQKREMISLRYLLGWRVTEIAAYLEMPENTVSVTIQRTLAQLRNRWPMMTSQKEQENVKI